MQIRMFVPAFKSLLSCTFDPHIKNLISRRFFLRVVKGA
jgi:hypothetical protein